VLCNLNCPGCHQLVASEENLDLPNIKDVRGKEPVSIPHVAAFFSVPAHQLEIDHNSVPRFFVKQAGNLDMSSETYKADV
jgi:hypothetical protein